MRTLHLVSVNGTEVTVTIEIEYSMMDVKAYDNYNIIIGKKLFKQEKINASANGMKWYLRDYYMRDCQHVIFKIDEKRREAFDSNPDIYCIVGGHNEKGQYINLALSYDQYNILQQAINKERESHTTEEAKKYINEKKLCEKYN